MIKLYSDLFSDRKIQNAAYWKIANIELGYNFPNEWFGKYVSDVRFYVSAHLLCAMRFLLMRLTEDTLEVVELRPKDPQPNVRDGVLVL